MFHMQRVSVIINDFFEGVLCDSTHSLYIYTPGLYGRRFPPIFYAYKLAISFYFVKCVIISCKLSFNSRFTCNQISDHVISRFSKSERQN